MNAPLPTSGPCTIEDLTFAPDATSPSPTVQASTVALFNAVLHRDVEQVRAALAQGARLDAWVRRSQHPGTFNLPTDEDLPPPSHDAPYRTPLGLAVWTMDHDPDGSPIDLRSARLADQGTVDALLDGGARVDPRMLARFEGTIWPFQAVLYQRLETNVLDQLANGTMDPAMIVRDPDSTVPNDPSDPRYGLPYTGSSDRLWSHRAALRAHWAALSGWLDQGGVLTTNKGGPLCGMVWQHLLKDPLGPFASPVPMLVERLRPWLMEAISVVYRREILATLNERQQDLPPAPSSTAIPPRNLAQSMCDAWLDALMQERPLDSYVLSPREDSSPWSPTTQRMKAHLMRMEQALLNRAATTETPATDPAAPRSRSRL